MGEKWACIGQSVGIGDLEGCEKRLYQTLFKGYLKVHLLYFKNKGKSNFISFNRMEYNTLFVHFFVHIMKAWNFYCDNNIILKKSIFYFVNIN